MATLEAGGTLPIDNTFTDTNLWTPVSPGIYTATGVFTPDTGTGTLSFGWFLVDETGYVVRDVSIGSYYDDFYQNSAEARLYLVPPVPDPTGALLCLGLLGDSIDGDTSLDWAVMKVADIA